MARKRPAYFDDFEDFDSECDDESGGDGGFSTTQWHGPTVREFRTFITPEVVDRCVWLLDEGVAFAEIAGELTITVFMVRTIYLAHCHRTMIANGSITTGQGRPL